MKEHNKVNPKLALTLICTAMLALAGCNGDKGGSTDGTGATTNATTNAPAEAATNAPAATNSPSQ